MNAKQKITARAVALVTTVCSLAMVTTVAAQTLTNGNFEADTVGNPPTGWTTYLQAATSGNWTIQTALPPEGTQYQQTQVYNVSKYGGVYQSVTGLTSGISYTIAGSYRTNSTSATASIRYNLSGDTDRANSTTLTSTTSTSWGTFNNTVTATGTSLVLFLDHNNGTSSNKASAFDNITVVSNCKTAAISSTTPPAPATVSKTVGDTATFSVTTDGTNATFQWKVSTDGGTTYTDVTDGTGGTTGTYTTATLSAGDDGKKFKCVVSVSCDSSTAETGEFTLSIASCINVSVNTQPTSPSAICVGSTASFSVVADGTEPIAYQWQVSTDSGANWNDVTDGTGGTTNSYTTAVTTAGMDGYRYRCVMTNCSGVGSVETDGTAFLTVIDVPAAPTEGTHITYNIAIAWTWNASPTATSYTLWDAPSGGNQIGGTLTGTSYLETGLLVNTAYTRYVEATSDCGNSTTRGELNATTGDGLCPDNSGFELFTDSDNNTPADFWTVFLQTGTGMTFPSSADAAEGVLSQRINFTSTNHIAYLYQKVTVAGGYKYQLTASYKMPAQQLRAMMQVDPAGGTPVDGTAPAGQHNEWQILPTDGWQVRTGSEWFRSDDGEATIMVGVADRTAASANRWGLMDRVRLSPGVIYPAPTATTICEGEAAPTFSITSVVGGGGGVTYQWQQALSGDPAYVDVPGATESSYDPGVLAYVPAGVNTHLYRCVITGTGASCDGPFYTPTSTVTISPDSDSDGVCDYLDGCPEDPLKTDPGLCDCGVPDTDADSDGSPGCLDCDDADPTVYPGATEILDGKDNNCNSEVDEGLTEIVARRVFYNNSYYDNNNVGIDAGTGAKTDSDAIDTSKSPLLTGGGTSVFANWTGYNKGINGLIYDIVAPAIDPVDTDFTFTDTGKAGTGSTPVSPSAWAVLVLDTGSPGTPRKVRIVFTFTDSSVRNTWLQVDVGTGFGAGAETHYWGNAVGEVGIGNTAPNILVSPADELQIRSHLTTALNRSPVTDPNDVNKTSLADPADQLIVRSNNTFALNCVKYITR